MAGCDLRVKKKKKKEKEFGAAYGCKLTTAARVCVTARGLQGMWART